MKRNPTIPTCLLFLFVLCPIWSPPLLAIPLGLVTIPSIHLHPSLFFTRNKRIWWRRFSCTTMEFSHCCFLDFYETLDSDFPLMWNKLSCLQKFGDSVQREWGKVTLSSRSWRRFPLLSGLWRHLDFVTWTSSTDFGNFAINPCQSFLRIFCLEEYTDIKRCVLIAFWYEECHVSWLFIF